MATRKLSKPKIGFVDLQNNVTDRAIQLEAKLMFAQVRSLRQLFICTPNRTKEFNK